MYVHVARKKDIVHVQVYIELKLGINLGTTEYWEYYAHVPLV